MIVQKEWVVYLLESDRLHILKADSKFTRMGVTRLHRYYLGVFYNIRRYTFRIICEL